MHFENLFHSFLSIAHISVHLAVCVGLFIMQEGDVCEGNRFDWTLQ